MIGEARVPILDVPESGFVALVFSLVWEGDSLLAGGKGLLRFLSAKETPLGEARDERQP